MEGPVGMPRFPNPAVLANTPRRGIPLWSRQDTIDSNLTAVDEVCQHEQYAKHLEKCSPKDTQEPGVPAVGEKADKTPEPATDCSWIVLIACTIIVSSTQGWGLLFGVFRPWFKRHMLSSAMSDSLIVLLATSQAMAMTLTSSVSGRLGDRYGPKPFIVVGCILFVASVTGCAFGKHVRDLFTTQVVQGIGAGLVFPPCMSLVARSWKHRAFPASSFLLACIPLYAFVAVLSSRALLNVVNHRQALLIFSGIHGIFLLSALFGLYDAPSPPETSPITWVDSNQIRDRRFWLLALSVMFTAFAMLTPFVFLTTYTVKTVPGISHQLSVLPLALVNLTAGFGRSIAALLIRSFASGPPSPTSPQNDISFGNGDDQYHFRLGVEPRRMFAGVIFLAALTNLIWAFAHSFGPILAYACINGLFGATFLSILPTLSAITFPEVNKSAAVGSLIIFAAPGCFFGAYVFDTLMHRTGSWMISLLMVSAFQAIGALFAFFV